MQSGMSHVDLAKRNPKLQIAVSPGKYLPELSIWTAQSGLKGQEEGRKMFCPKVYVGW